MNKTVMLIALIFIAVLGIGGFILASNTNLKVSSFGPSGNTHIISYTSKDGYAPSEIKIKKGDTVTFKNDSDRNFWPASNIHPTHGIYPEFDPQEAIPYEKSWSFKFEKTGTWRYHDHLAPYFTGRITVE